MSQNRPQQHLPAELRKLAGKHKGVGLPSLIELGVIDEQQLVNCLVETPAGSRSKYDYDPDSGLFLLDRVLPVGMTFPYDFGFIPMTLGEDGDPVDIVLLLDEPAYPGVLVKTKIIGILKAEQTESDGRRVRNDRLLGRNAKSVQWQDVESLSDLPPNLCKNVEKFFQNYNEQRGKKFHPQGWLNSEEAFKAIETGVDDWQASRNEEQKRKAG